MFLRHQFVQPNEVISLLAEFLIHHLYRKNNSGFVKCHMIILHVYYSAEAANIVSVEEPLPKLTVLNHFSETLAKPFFDEN